MTITLNDVSKAAIEIIDKAGLYHFETGDGPAMCRSTKLEGIKGAHLSENYLYLEGYGECAVIDNRLYSYLEMM